MLQVNIIKVSKKLVYPAFLLMSDLCDNFLALNLSDYEGSSVTRSRSPSGVTCSKFFLCNW